MNTHSILTTGHMTEPAPISLIEMTVPPEWLDYNGHMNIAHYTSAVDHAINAFLDIHDLGEKYTRTTAASMFMIQQHVHYRREIMAGQNFCITGQMLGLDEKRMHLFLNIISPEDGDLFASSEFVAIHVNMKVRKATPIPTENHRQLAALLAAHSSLSRPELAGRPIGVSAVPGKNP